MYVKHDKIGERIGAELISYVEEVARNKGIKKITLEAVLNSIGFYEKMGYVKLREKQVKHEFADFMVWVMEKKIGKFL